MTKPTTSRGERDSRQLASIRRIPVERPTPYWRPPRLSVRGTVALVVGSLATSLILGETTRTESPVIGFVFFAAALVASWFWIRRPARWLIDNGDGTLSVHHRNVFFLPMTGQHLDTIRPAAIDWDDGPWWRLGWLEIDGQRWHVLADGQEAARHLANRISSGAYHETARGIV